ncbi:hypothetical protein CEXT_450091, partial [Caerostris extrusa]
MHYVYFLCVLVTYTTAFPLDDDSSQPYDLQKCESMFESKGIYCNDIVTDVVDGCTLYCLCDETDSLTYEEEDNTPCGQNQVCMSGSCVADQSDDD